MQRFMLKSCVSLFVLANLCLTTQAAEHTLSGQVLDKDGNAIKGVQIILSQGSRPPKTVRTDMDGNYAITFPDGEPVDTIEYKLEEWNPATIAGLSGKRDQRVHKTMYSQGAGLTVLQAEEVLESLERIYRTNTNRKRTPEEIRGEYREFVEKLLVPKELNARLSAVRALYALPPT